MNIFAATTTTTTTTTNDNYNMSSSFMIKYKPSFIEDFYMDSELTSSLHSFIELNDLNLLLIGTSCSGKTSLLNAIIREYYHLEKKGPLPEKNILFINNLKEQGIGFFRNEMKTFCQSQSVIYGKKKIIVIDDIDTINEQSQQVFRNYIDKYKHNVHFISACTNIQKVIENIQSRLHIFCIRPPTTQQILLFTRKIIYQENIQIDEESIAFLTKYSKKTIRLVLNNLEKIFLYNQPVDIVLCKKLLTDVSFENFELYISLLKEKKLSEAIHILYKICDFGYSVIDVLEYFYSFVILSETIEENVKYQIFSYLCKYITNFHAVHENIIELSLFTNDLLELFNIASLPPSEKL